VIPKPAEPIWKDDVKLLENRQMKQKFVFQKVDQ